MFILFALLCATNSYWYITNQKLRNSAKSRENSLELDEFLSDMLAGGGIIRVQRINPSDVLIRHRRA